MAGGIGSGRLTDKGVKAFVANAVRGKKLADGGGLYLSEPLAAPALQGGLAEMPARGQLFLIEVDEIHAPAYSPQFLRRIPRSISAGQPTAQDWV